MRKEDIDIVEGKNSGLDNTEELPGIHGSLSPNKVKLQHSWDSGTFGLLTIIWSLGLCWIVFNS